MRRSVHLYAILLFLIALFYDFSIWGGAAHLPEVGKLLLRSAEREAPLITFYMRAGDIVDSAVPMLDDFGQRHAQAAFGDGLDRIRAEPEAAMDLIFSNTWGPQHAFVKAMVWAPLLLFPITLVLWLKRPKTVHLMGSKR